MEERITAQQLYDACHRRLELDWVYHPTGEPAPIVPLPTGQDNRSLIGHLNFIHPHRIQVIGASEMAYLKGLGKNSHNDVIRQLFSARTAMVILADGLSAAESMQQRARKQGIPLLRSTLNSNRLISDISFYLRSLVADTQVVHGVFMDVLGIGVLLTGESAIGKSELALELVTRGHRLIADDAPVFVRSAPGVLSGHCPEMLQNFLEVRGLGVLNIRAMFGDVAVKQQMELHLIVHLAPVKLEHLQQLDRLKGTRRKRLLLEVEVDEVELPVAPGRNLAVLVEAAARNHILHTNGYDAAQDFVGKQQELMHGDST
ncbi:MAG: HPr(Ser) kinase/phosphatase [Gammaproteobacteria bacterium]|nr:HPr(Ser) kinase/phosphatase [Gammaproteobacteria bacterium]